MSLKLFSALAFASVLILPRAFAGIDAVEMPIALQNSETLNQKFMVVKRDESRAFYKCATVEGKIDRPSCNLLTTFTTHKFQMNKKQLNDGKWISWQSTWRWTFSGVASVVGLVPAVIISATTDGGNWNTGKTSTRAFIITEAVIVGTAYMLGSWADGDHFSALETASVLGTIGRPEVLDLDAAKELSLPVSVGDFENMVATASQALRAAN